MGRPPLAIGDHGTIKTTKVLDDDGKVLHHEARCRYRGHDGATHQLSRIGSSKSRAEANLRAGVKDAVDATNYAGADLSGDTRYETLARLWLERIRRDRAPHTYDGYLRVMETTVLPRLGQYRLRELNRNRASGFVDSIRGRYKPNGLRHVVKIAAGPLSIAARERHIIETNPFHDMTPIRGKGKRSQALSAYEQHVLCGFVDRDPECRRYDFPDLLAVMLGTGCRIGEALALRWCDVDLTANTIHVCGTVVRPKGQGMQRSEGTKTRESELFSERTLRLPEHAALALQVRWDPRFNSPDHPVFPGPRTWWRDPNLVNALIRRIRDRVTADDGTVVPLPWMTSHTYRHTVAHVMDEGKCSAREIADQLGHAKPSMSQDTYMVRSGTNTQRAVDVLQARFTTS